MSNYIRSTYQQKKQQHKRHKKPTIFFAQDSAAKL